MISSSENLVRGSLTKMLRVCDASVDAKRRGWRSGEKLRERGGGGSRGEPLLNASAGVGVDHNLREHTIVVHKGLCTHGQVLVLMYTPTKIATVVVYDAVAAEANSAL